MRRAARILDATIRALAALVLAAVLALVATSAISRYLLGAPARFLEELSGLLMIALLFLALAVQGREGHIRVGFLADRARGAGALVFRVLALLVVLAFAGLFAWDAAQQALFNFERNIRSELGGIPIWPFSMLIPISLALLVLRLVVEQIAHAPASDGANRG